jgi:hypothetical protein
MKPLDDLKNHSLARIIADLRNVKYWEAMHTLKHLGLKKEDFTYVVNTLKKGKDHEIPSKTPSEEKCI